MTRKKSRFMTFLISLMPGAGEMYLGFYKCGTSIMVPFLGGLVIFSALIPQFLYLLTVLWFFSFFHTNNINSLPDEEFYAIEDDYLMSMSPENVKQFCGRYKKYIGILLLILGISIAWNGACDLLEAVLMRMGLPSEDFSVLSQSRDAISQLIAAVIIVFLGLKLFQAKKESLQTPPYLYDRITGPAPTPYAETDGSRDHANTAAEAPAPEGEKEKSRAASSEAPREMPETSSDAN